MQFTVVVLCVLFSNTYSKLLELNCNDIRKFVDGHNNRRLRVARGEVEKQPAATDMQSLVWDEELAAKAAKWASSYRQDHNPNADVASHRFTVGENLYYYATTDRNFKFSPSHALYAWFEEEHPHYRYGKIVKVLRQSTGHYTQMVWANTTYVGCAVSRFQVEIFIKYFVVCNYGPSGNIIGKNPYKMGKKDLKRQLGCHVEECKRPYGKHCPEQ